MAKRRMRHQQEAHPQANKEVIGPASNTMPAENQNSQSITQHPVLQMQQVRGNRAVARQLAPRSTVQRALETDDNLTGFGLALNQSISDFTPQDLNNPISDFAQHVVGKHANRRLEVAQIPKVNILTTGVLPGNVDALFSRESWAIYLNGPKLNARGGTTTGEGGSATPILVKDLDQAKIKEIVSLVYHEARHAEQYYRMAQYVAGKGSTVTEIGDNLKMSEGSKQRTERNQDAFTELNTIAAEEGMTREEVGTDITESTPEISAKIINNLSMSLNVPVPVVTMLIEQPETLDPIVQYISLHLEIPYAVAEKAKENPMVRENASFSFAGLLNIQTQMPTADYMQVALWYQGVYGITHDFNQVIYQLIPQLKEEVPQILGDVRGMVDGAPAALDDIVTNWKDELLDQKLRPTLEKIKSEGMFSEIIAAVNIDKIIPLLQDAINKWNTAKTSNGEQLDASLNAFQKACKTLQPVIIDVYEQLRLESDAHWVGDKAADSRQFQTPS